MTSAEQVIADIFEEYRDEQDCDACEDCGKLFMCRFHSVLSVLAGRTCTNGAIERDRLKSVAGLSGVGGAKT